VTTSTWFSDVRRLCDWLIPPARKNTYYERNRRKIATDQHDDQQQTKKGLTIGHLECTITVLYRPEGLRIAINELRKYKIAISAIRKLTPQAFTSNCYNIYTSSFANNHEFGTAFLVDSKFNHMVINFTPINERLFVIRIKGRFFN
jgi:hypothetical protein